MSYKSVSNIEFQLSIRLYLLTEILIEGVIVDFLLLDIIFFELIKFIKSEGVFYFFLLYRKVSSVVYTMNAKAYLE